MPHPISPMHPRFPLNEIPKWAERYGDPAQDHDAERAGAAARDRGWLTADELRILADWKSPRIRRWIARNTEAGIEDFTRLALSTENERLRIEVPTLLHGVGYPMASVILHFCHTDPYPVLDFRAVWTLQSEEPSSGYTFDFWQQYTSTCRDLAKEAGCSIRTLDRALWAYSKING